MKRTFVFALAAITLLLPAAASADQQYYELRELAKRSLTAKQLVEWEAEAQGYANRVLDLELCQGAVVITDPDLRAKLDNKYRNDPRYQKVYYRGYLTPDIGLMAPGFPTLELKRQIRCLSAVSNAPWLALAPGGAEQLERNVKEETRRNAKELADKARQIPKGDK
jgi:hypothetical protein